MATKKDFTQVAHAVFMKATGAAPIKAQSVKQAAGRKGGLTGGKKRMDALTAEQKHELAMRGVRARRSESGPQPDAPSNSRKD